MVAGSVVALHIYPVKSCRGIALQEAVVSAYGLAGDRVWQVVDEAGAALSQRTHPALATVVPSLGAEVLRLSAPGHATVEVAASSIDTLRSPDKRPSGPSAPRRTVRALLGDEVEVVDAGDEVAAWLASVLATPCRLVSLASAHARRIPLVGAQPLSFVDAGPVLVANSASLADLQARATEPFGMDRFRPNVVIETDQAWTEDTWATFSVGGAELSTLAPWPRCAVPQVDQDSGARTKEPAVTLRAHRWCTEAPTAPAGFQPFLRGKGLFGIGATIAPEGTVVRVGDPLTVRTTATAVIPAPHPLA